MRLMNDLSVDVMMYRVLTFGYSCNLCFKVSLTLVLLLARGLCCIISNNQVSLFSKIQLLVNIGSNVVNFMLENLDNLPLSLYLPFSSSVELLSLTGFDQSA